LAGRPEGRAAKKIGTWPTSRGQVMGSRPVGLNFPVSMHGLKIGCRWVDCPRQTLDAWRAAPSLDFLA
jgi:hypothetical protein